MYPVVYRMPKADECGASEPLSDLLRNTRSPPLDTPLASHQSHPVTLRKISRRRERACHSGVVVLRSAATGQGCRTCVARSLRTSDALPHNGIRRLGELGGRGET